jgi:hypothetical protein
MSEFEEVQRIIRLKRHERPPEGFIDEFLSEFHERQRAEVLRRSARGLLWERVTTYLSELLNPKWAWAGATVAAVVAVGWMMRPAPQSSAAQLAKNQPSPAAGSAVQNLDAAPGVKQDLERLQRYLLKNHFEGGLGSEQRPADKTFPVGGFHPDLNTTPALPR